MTDIQKYMMDKLVIYNIPPPISSRMEIEKRKKSAVVRARVERNQVNEQGPDEDDQ